MIERELFVRQTLDEDENSQIVVDAWSSIAEAQRPMRMARQKQAAQSR